MRAVRLRGVDRTKRARAQTPPKVHGARNRLEVIWVAAVSNAAEMVELQSGRDRAAKSLVDELMYGYAALPAD